MTAPHPLLEIFLAAADGRFPPPEGSVTVVPAFDDGTEAVVSFTAAVFLATALDAGELTSRGADAYGGALHPDVLHRLTGGGDIDVLDATLVGRGTGEGPRLDVRHDLDAHPRVRRALAWRRDVVVYGDDRGLVTVGTGLAGRTELSIELDPARCGQGQGGGLIRDALAGIAAGTPVFAAVAPGNARSLRAFLRCGFRPIGSEVLIRPARS